MTRRLPDGGLDPLAAHELVGPNADDAPFSPDELRRARGARSTRSSAVLTDKIDADVLEAGAAGGQLRVVANVAVGYDNIDVRAAREHGDRRVQHARRARRDHRRSRVHVDPRRVAARARRRGRSARRAAGTGWGITQYLGRDVHGATLGIVGYGRIGRAVARRAVGLRHAGAAPRAHRYRRAGLRRRSRRAARRPPTSCRCTCPAARRPGT